MHAGKTCRISFAVVTLAAMTFSLAVCAQAQTETVLYSFGGVSSGEFPLGGLVLDAAGNLYGTTANGGNSTNCFDGCGTVFKLSQTPSGQWKKTVLHYFAGSTDGSYPASKLVFDGSGNLYGATQSGGSGNGCCGVVFKLTPATSGTWKEKILFAFAGGATGAIPSNVTFDAAGNLYGTALGGGNVSDCQNQNQGGCGLVFRLSPTASGPWKERVLFKFIGRGDGGNPEGGVVLDAAGNMYLIATSGGIGCSPYGCGVALELSPTASGPWNETTLHQFTGGADGGFVSPGLALDASGNVYGSTDSDGANGFGTIFEISPTSSGWAESTILNLDNATNGNGTQPLIFDPAGNLHVENSGGGSKNCGTVFELSPSSGWQESGLFTFDCTDGGANPDGGLTLDANGNLYGVTGNGGAAGTGVVFRINP
ncbi:MAG: choice-of-anchor tandem repeat GloVer-containing protein [Candidatus Sulfotelmatobacter sp.]